MTTKYENTRKFIVGCLEFLSKTELLLDARNMSILEIDYTPIGFYADIDGVSVIDKDKLLNHGKSYFNIVVNVDKNLAGVNIHHDNETVNQVEMYFIDGDNLEEWDGLIAQFNFIS